MTDTPSPRERFLDSRRLVAAGGMSIAVIVLVCASLVRVRPAIDEASWDRVASALADTPAGSQLLVVRAAARTGDAQLADAVLRLTAAGASQVALALDLSQPVPPTGAMADIVTRAPALLLAATITGDSVAWPWFLTDSTRLALSSTGRLAIAALERDADGVVRRSLSRQSAWPSFAERLGAASANTAVGQRDAVRLMRFASTSQGWHGLPSTTLADVLRMPDDSLRMLVGGKTLIVGIDDGARVPTSVGALPTLAVVAHDVAARARVLAGEEPAVHPVSDRIAWAWLLPWIMLGAALTAITSWPTMLGVSILGIVVQATLVVRMVEAEGAWLPLGSTIVAWLAAIGGAAAVAAWQVRRAQQFTTQLFSRFMTPALADAAWRARHLYLDGGRPAPMLVPVTVLFLDLRGFTRFSEGTSPAAVMALLTEVTAACADLIASHGGLVDDFAGDGIKADFGVPVPRTTPDAIARDAQQAVTCALALSYTLARMLPATLGTLGTQVRIGLHSGSAVAGTIGGAARLKYTVAGDVVNVAARLQSIDLGSDAVDAHPCRILLSAETLALVGTRAPAVSNEGAVLLKGRESPVYVHRVIADADLPFRP